MNKLFIFSIFLAFSLGAFIFLLHKKLVILEFSWPQQTEFLNVGITEQKIALFYPRVIDLSIDESEFRTIVWDRSNICLYIKSLVTEWLAVLFEEKVITDSVILYAVYFNALETEAYFSFDRPLCNKNWSIQKKWRVIETLLKTIRTAIPTIKTIYFLVNNEYMQDSHLDFSQGWPVEGFCEKE